MIQRSYKLIPGSSAPRRPSPLRNFFTPTETSASIAATDNNEAEGTSSTTAEEGSVPARDPEAIGTPSQVSPSAELEKVEAERPYLAESRRVSLLIKLVFESKSL